MYACTPLLTLAHPCSPSSSQYPSLRTVGGKVVVKRSGAGAGAGVVKERVFRDEVSVASTTDTMLIERAAHPPPVGQFNKNKVRARSRVPSLPCPTLYPLLLTWRRVTALEEAPSARGGNLADWQDSKRSGQALQICTDTADAIRHGRDLEARRPFVQAALQVEAT